MKKILLSAMVLSLTGLTAFAQQPVTQISPVQIQGNGHGNSVQNVVDTLTDYLNRATGFYSLNAGAPGYVLGTSNVQTGTGCHYTAVGSAHVTELMVYFAHKTIVNTADNISAEIMLVGADSMPTTLVSSGSLNLANADVSGFPTFIPMSNYVNQTGDFFAAIRYGNIDDTIVIMSTNPTTSGGGPDGANEKRVRQNTSGIIWERAWDLWTVGGQPYNADALILPVVDIQAGLNNQFTMNGFSLYAPYPVPAANLITVPFSVEKAQEVKLTVFNELGQPVSEINLGTVMPGQINYQIDLTNFASGNYFFMLDGASGRIASKFSVSK